MEVNYNRLWKLLIDKGINKTELREKTGMGSNTLAKMGKNQCVSMEVLLKICTVLDCNIDDVCEFVKCDVKDGIENE